MPPSPDSAIFFSFSKEIPRRSSCVLPWTSSPRFLATYFLPSAGSSGAEEMPGDPVAAFYSRAWFELADYGDAAVFGAMENISIPEEHK